MAIITIKPEKRTLEDDYKFEPYPECYLADFEDSAELDMLVHDIYSAYVQGIDNNSRLSEAEKAKQKGKKIPFHLLAEFIYSKLILGSISVDDSDLDSLYIYNPKEGIYQSAYHVLTRLVKKVDSRYKKRDVEEVLYSLYYMSPKLEAYTGTRYIALGNCIYDRGYCTPIDYSPSIVFTTKVATNYNKDISSVTLANGWNIDSWLEDLFHGDENLVTLAWQVICATVIGYADERMVWLIGPGGTGKGTFQKLLSNLVGGVNTASMKISELDGRNRFATSQLIGKRLVIGDDNPISVSIKDPSVMFSLITGDIITVEKKNKQAYSAWFRPVIIQSANKLIPISGEKRAIERRTIILPFTAKFNEEGYDRDIKNIYLNRQDVLEYVLMKSLNYDTDRGFVDVSFHPIVREIKGESQNSIDKFSAWLFSAVKSDFLPNPFVKWAYNQFCLENTLSQENEYLLHKQLKAVLPDGWNFKSTLSNWNDFSSDDIELFENPSEQFKFDESRRQKGYIHR